MCLQHIWMGRVSHMGEALEGCPKKHICIYVKWDVRIFGKRRVYSTYEWAMSHERARRMRDVRRNIYEYMSKETYVHLKKDVFVARMDEPCFTNGRGTWGVSKETYMYMSKETYIHLEKDVFTAFMNGPSHMHGQGTWGMSKETYIYMSKETYVGLERDVFTAHLNRPCLTHGRGSWGMSAETCMYICQKRRMFIWKETCL